MNVLLLTVDCLRHDKIGSVAGRSDLTPNIDRLCQESTLFAQAIAQGYNTATSFPSIFTSTYPKLQRGGWRNRPLMGGQITLASLLGQQGWATGGFHSNPWLSTHFGHGQEYDVYEDNLFPVKVHSWSKTAMQVQRAFRSISPYLPADKVTAQAVDWIKQQRGPFFAWVHYMDAHSPYRVSSKLPAWLAYLWSWRLYRKARTRPEAMTGAEHQKLLSRYEEGIRFIDQSWGRFREELEASGQMADTLVVLTADHGEGFREHGYYGHGAYFFDESLRVPLLVRWPGEDTVPMVQGQVELTTIVPTVLDALDLPVPDHLVGQSALPWLRGEAEPQEPVNAEAFSSGDIREGRASVCVRTDEWKYVLRRSVRRELHESQLYHLAGDPEERDECGARYPEVVERLNGRAEAHIEQVLTGSEPGGEEVDLPEEVVDRLRALGYVD
jgi:arylsulfatase A-like enzyme